MYNSNRSENLYVGFKLCDKRGKPDFRMFIQMPVPSTKKQRDALATLGGWQDPEDDKLLNFDQKIANSEYDGKADKMIGWFTDKLFKIEDHKNDRT